MPALDGSGPLGMGSGTGGRSGYCSGYVRNIVPGRRSGFGCGGRGRRNQFCTTGFSAGQPNVFGYPVQGGATPNVAPPAPQISNEQQIEILKNQAQYFEDALKEVQERIKELQVENKEK